MTSASERAASLNAFHLESSTIMQPPLIFVPSIPVPCGNKMLAQSIQFDQHGWQTQIRSCFCLSSSPSMLVAAAIFQLACHVNDFPATYAAAAGMAQPGLRLSSCFKTLWVFATIMVLRISLSCSSKAKDPAARIKEERYTDELKCRP
jgi:hypothetical protein